MSRLPFSTLRKQSVFLQLYKADVHIRRDLFTNYDAALKLESNFMRGRLLIHTMILWLFTSSVYRLPQNKIHHNFLILLWLLYSPKLVNLHEQYFGPSIRMAFKDSSRVLVFAFYFFLCPLLFFWRRFLKKVLMTL